MAPPFRPGRPHPGPLPLSGRGDVCIVGGGFGWCLGGVWECVIEVRGFGEWRFLRESVTLRRVLRFLRSTTP